MLKAVIKSAGDRDLVLLGLSFGNLDRFRAQPCDSFIRINGEGIGVPVDILLFSGETEAAMVEMVKNGIEKGSKS